MNRLRPKAIDDGTPCSALTVYSSASQSPMNGSTKTRMRIREISAGGSHQRHDENSLERIGTVTIFDLSFFDLRLPLGEGRGGGEATDARFVLTTITLSPYPLPGGEAID